MLERRINNISRPTSGESFAKSRPITDLDSALNYLNSRVPQANDLKPRPTRIIKALENPKPPVTEVVSNSVLGQGIPTLQEAIRKFGIDKQASSGALETLGMEKEAAQARKRELFPEPYVADTHNSTPTATEKEPRVASPASKPVSGRISVLKELSNKEKLVLGEFLANLRDGRIPRLDDPELSADEQEGIRVRFDLAELLTPDEAKELLELNIQSKVSQTQAKTVPLRFQGDESFDPSTSHGLSPLMAAKITPAEEDPDILGKLKLREYNQTARSVYHRERRSLPELAPIKISPSRVLSVAAGVLLLLSGYIGVTKNASGQEDVPNNYGSTGDESGLVVERKSGESIMDLVGKTIDPIGAIIQRGSDIFGKLAKK